jgi:hypothetical protein
LALASLSTAAGFPTPQYLYVWGLALLLVCGLAASEWRARPRAESVRPDRDATSELRVLAAVTLLTCIAGFTAFLWFARLRTEPWYFLPLMVLAALCLDLAWPPLRGGVLTAWLAGVILTGVLAVPAAGRAVHYRFTNADLVADRLRREASPEDFVVVVPWNRGISFQRYFHNWTLWNTVPPLADHSTHRYDLVQRQTQSQDPLHPLFERIATTLQSGHRVWVVGALEVPPPGLPLPSNLPPPPLKHTGWSAGPYVRNWTDQTAQFLSNHSRRFAAVAMGTDERINENERLDLFAAEGWQESN